MCDYCDCRSHPEIASLSSEHEVLLDLLARLELAAGSVDRDGARSIAEQLHHLLDHHATREEHGVFVEVRETVDGEYVARFEADHHRIHELVAATRGDGWVDAAVDLVRSLREHIAREESDLFPAAHQLLTPAQWDRIHSTGQVVREVVPQRGEPHAQA